MLNKNTLILLSISVYTMKPYTEPETNCNEIPSTSSKVTMASPPSNSMASTSPPPDLRLDWKYTVSSDSVVPSGNPETKIRERSMSISVDIKECPRTCWFEIPPLVKRCLTVLEKAGNVNHSKKGGPRILMSFSFTEVWLVASWLLWLMLAVHWLATAAPCFYWTFLRNVFIRLFNFCEMETRSWK